MRSFEASSQSPKERKVTSTQVFLNYLYADLSYLQFIGQNLMNDPLSQNLKLSPYISDSQLTILNLNMARLQSTLFLRKMH